SSSRPSDAITLRLGDRGRADVWGELVVADSFDALESASVALSAKAFPISLADNSGRTELEAELSSDRIDFQTDAGGGGGRIAGEVLIDRSVWLRDARQGVAVLSFADPNPAPPSQLPEFLRRLELLGHVVVDPERLDRTQGHLELEATAVLTLGGYLGDPELTGTIAIERGVVDIDILGGAYDVTGGRVDVHHDLTQSSLNLKATRQKPIKVNNQLLTLNLILSGTLDAIAWECSAPGDTSGAVATTQGCVDYLIFDAGNTEMATSDVRENRNNNSLIGTRFLPLAGRLTQVELNEVIARENSRVEAVLPIVGLRLDGVGVVIDVSTRSEWGRWGWGRLGLNFTYVRGYPGSVLRDSRTFSGRLEILENAAIEAAFGFRNYTNRVLVLDPPNSQSIEFRQRFDVPSRR
ncbi:MAG TPA: translocation/assembly module TamB domain-containing protein, partial [Enhygromyxa sp.]|nr:translocation/assembly module TamB domain-containing protein [Enhygromyxa sp.]